MGYKTFRLITILCILWLTYYVSRAPDRDAIRSAEINRVPPPPQPSYNKYKGYNFETGGYRPFSDEEIRELRNDNPEYIIRTPGRIVRSSRDQFRYDFEEYYGYEIEELEDMLNEIEDND